MLVGHDNADYFKTTLNDCGLESLYSPEEELMDGLQIY